MELLQSPYVLILLIAIAVFLLHRKLNGSQTVEDAVITHEDIAEVAEDVEIENRHNVVDVLTQAAVLESHSVTALKRARNYARVHNWGKYEDSEGALDDILGELRSLRGNLNGNGQVSHVIEDAIYRVIRRREQAMQARTRYYPDR